MSSCHFVTISVKLETFKISFSEIENKTHLLLKLNVASL